MSVPAPEFETKKEPVVPLLRFAPLALEKQKPKDGPTPRPVALRQVVAAKGPSSRAKKCSFQGD